MQNIVFFLASGELCIMDKLACIKMSDWCHSPFIRSRCDFWQNQVELFPAYSPFSPCFYWKKGPVLELPERAESLQNWSHCIFCGRPLDSEVCNDE